MNLIFYVVNFSRSEESSLNFSLSIIDLKIEYNDVLKTYITQKLTLITSFYVEAYKDSTKLKTWKTFFPDGWPYTIDESYWMEFPVDEILLINKIRIGIKNGNRTWQRIYIAIVEVVFGDKH